MTSQDDFFPEFLTPDGIMINRVKKKTKKCLCPPPTHQSSRQKKQDKSSNDEMAANFIHFFHSKEWKK